MHRWRNRAERPRLFNGCDATRAQTLLHCMRPDLAHTVQKPQRENPHRSESGSPPSQSWSGVSGPRAVGVRSTLPTQRALVCVLSGSDGCTPWANFNAGTWDRRHRGGGSLPARPRSSNRCWPVVGGTRLIHLRLFGFDEACARCQATRASSCRHRSAAHELARICARYWKSLCRPTRRF
jgi:hypothetical protein